MRDNKRSLHIGAARNYSLPFVLLAALGFACGMRAQGAAPAAPKALSTQQPASKSAPRDLSGVWRRVRRPSDTKRKYTLYEIALSLSEPPPMTPWGLEKFKAAKPNVGPHAVTLAQTNDPTANCFPPGVPKIYLMRGAPFEIVQASGRVLMYFEYDHFVREIFSDGRQHTEDVNPTWMGEAIGKWEGNTLVVDTVGFNDKTWLDYAGHPHSDQLHLVERIQRPSHDTLVNDITIDDPKAYTKPWTTHMAFDLKPDWKIEETICEDNANFSNVQKISESNK
jgi:hypothetical protein